MKKLTKLDQLESKSIYIIREAYSRFKKLGMLWSIGKDSTTLGLVIAIMRPEVNCTLIEPMERRAGWLREEADRLGIGPKDKLKCCGMRKTEALKQTIDKYGFEALLLGIRSDEHGVRAKERTFSPRNRDFQWDYKNQAPELWDQYKSQKTSR